MGAVLGRALGTTSEDSEAGRALLNFQHLDIDPIYRENGGFYGKIMGKSRENHGKIHDKWKFRLGRLGSTKNWSFSEPILV